MKITKGMTVRLDGTDFSPAMLMRVRSLNHGQRATLETFGVTYPARTITVPLTQLARP